MALDPVIKRLLKKAYLNGYGDIHQFDSEQMRNYFSHPKLRVEAASFQDFQTSDELQLRCFTPNGCETSHPLPAVIFVSANGLVIDRLDGSNDYCSLLANTLKMKVIYICHRLIPETKFPHFIYDTQGAIEWIYAEADELRINKDQLVLWGESSGGFIASACTHLLRDEGKNLIQHLVLFYPLVDQEHSSLSRIEFEHGFMLDKSFLQWLQNKGFKNPEDRYLPLASPLRLPNFTGLPSSTIITAECDPLRDEAEMYAQKLQAAGVTVRLKRFEGVIHGFMRYYPAVWASKDALEFVADSLQNT